MGVQITIRDVPKEVRDELAARAARSGKSMQEYLKEELVRIAGRPPVEEWLERGSHPKGSRPENRGGRCHRDPPRRGSPMIAAGHVVDASVLVAALVDSGDDGDLVRTRDRERLSGGAGSGHRRGLEHPAATRARRAGDGVGSLVGATRSPRPRDRADADPALRNRIWELRSNLTCYDAWYVAVAEALELPLATLDRRLARATGPSCEIRAPSEG